MNNEMSLFVPHVFSVITKEKIASIFVRFGEISRIDLVSKKTGNNAAYIRFSKWYDTEENRGFQNQLTTGVKKAHVIYDDKWFWIVLENKRTMPKTPKKILKRVTPSTPIKKINNSVTEVDISDIVWDLFGNENYDLVDATYVYYMENEVKRLTELNWQLSQLILHR